MWYNEHLIEAKQCNIITCKRIEDLALQKWYTDISISPMCTLYILFKNISILKSTLYIHVTEIDYRYQKSHVQTVNYPFINIYIHRCITPIHVHCAILIHAVMNIILY